MSEPWHMSKRDFRDCDTLEQVERKIMKRIDTELSEQQASEIAMLESRGASVAEISDFVVWRIEAHRRWRETTARQLALFLRHPDFTGSLQ